MNPLRNLDRGFIVETDFYGEPLHLIEPEVRFQVEDYLDAIDEMRELYPDHWKEIALDHDKIKLDPDYDRYELLSRAGVLHVVTARSGPKLVGYHMSIVMPHLHYKSSLTAFTDVFYLKPEYRKGMTGYRLLRTFRDSVKARGVQKVYMMTKLGIDLDPVLKRLGFKPIERVYAQVF